MTILAFFFLFAGAVGAAARWLKRPLDLPTLALFVLLPVVFLSPGFFAGKTPLPLDLVRDQFPPWNAGAHPAPRNPSLNDLATQFAPWAKAVRMAWKEGSLPFWNRWNGCGMPLAANGQSQAFSPFTLLMFALPLARAYVLLGATKLFLALCGIWLWLREMGISIRASRFGAVVFAFSFAMTPWLYHPASAEICLWPWVFFVVELLADPATSKRAFATLVAVLALWPLCGHLETAALGALFGVIWLGLRTLAGDIASPRRVLGGACLAAAAALGLSAFSLLPQIHAVSASNRLVLARDPDHLDFVPWFPYRPGWLGGFVTPLFPLAFGDMIESPMIPGSAGSVAEMGFGYIGVIGWSCALVVLTPRLRRRGAKGWILLALVLLGLGIAMGLPPFRGLVGALPGIRFIPPLRLLVFVSTAGAPLAALGLDGLLREELGRSEARTLAGTVLAISVAAVAVFLFLRKEHALTGGLPSQASALLRTLTFLLLAAGAAILFSRKFLTARAFAAAMTLLAAAELLHQGLRLYRFNSPAELYPETPLLRFFASRPSPYRIATEDGALFPNTNVFATVENIGTHDPAERRDYVKFLDLAAGYPPFEYFKRISNLNSSAFDFLNVKYLATPPGSSAPGPKWTAAYDGPDGRLFENRDVLARVFAPRRIRLVSPSGTGAAARRNAILAFGRPLEELVSRGSFAEEAVVLEKPGMAVGLPHDGSNGTAQIGSLTETTNRVRFAASASRVPALLVTSFVTDGGWSAKDEAGMDLPVSLADGPFLALRLPPGHHVVTLTYRPPGFRLGAILAAATFLALAAPLAFRPLRPRITRL